MVTQEELKKGMWVTYTPDKPESGTVTSWNSIFVFVEYGTGTPRATKYDDLIKGKLWEIWIEEEGKAPVELLGVYFADTFDEAVLKMLMQRPGLAEYYHRSGIDQSHRIWFRKLYDNERDARNKYV